MGCPVVFGFSFALCVHGLVFLCVHVCLCVRVCLRLWPAVAVCGIVIGVLCLITDVTNISTTVIIIVIIIYMYI